MSDHRQPTASESGVTLPNSNTPSGDDSYSPRIMLREKTDDDRRGSDRRSYHVGVYIDSGAAEGFGLSGNISRGGIFVVTDDPPPLSSEVELEFLLEDSTSLMVDGVVRWVRQSWDPDAKDVPGFGVEFVELDRHQRNRLDLLLDELDESRRPLD